MIRQLPYSKLDSIPTGAPNTLTIAGFQSSILISPPPKAGSETNRDNDTNTPAHIAHIFFMIYLHFLTSEFGKNAFLPKLIFALHSCQYLFKISYISRLDFPLFAHNGMVRSCHRHHLISQHFLSYKAILRCNSRSRKPLSHPLDSNDQKVN